MLTGGSQTPDKPFLEAGRSLIRGPDRAGALAYLLMLGSVFVLLGWGVTDVTGDSSAYFEAIPGSLVLSAICFLWLRMRRGGVDWLAPRARRGRR